MMSIFDDFYDDREESFVSPEALKMLKEIVYDEGIDEYLERIFEILRKYYDAARKEFWDDEIAKEMVMLAFQRWLETGVIL